MYIYWMFLILSLIVMLVSYRVFNIVEVYGKIERRGSGIIAFLFFAVITFFCGVRSGIADTGTYIYMFEQWPSKLTDIHWDEFPDQGFYFLTVAYKYFISDHFQGWLFVIALISSIAMMRAFLKYSDDFGLSCFLFIASTTFTYLINGIRQFIVVAIMFSCINYIIERKFFRYIFLILLLSTIHGSAYILIPFYFVNRVKPFGRTMWISVFLISMSGILMGYMTSILNAIMNDTQYEGYIDIITSSGTGASAFRLLIALVPCILAYLGRELIILYDSPIINIAIFSSYLTAALYFVAMLSSGMVIGRVLIYFEVYNLILLPWLIQNVFEKKSSRIVTAVCVVAYILFFYIQMKITWDIGYESEFLRLFL